MRDRAGFFPRAPITPARADEKNFALQKFQLTLFADFGDYEMARVAGQLIGGELAIGDPWEAAIFPGIEAAFENVNILVAQLFEDLRHTGA